MANTRDYGKFQRPSFVDGGAVNQSVNSLKQMLADTGVDKPTKAALERRQTAATTNSATSSNGDPYGWESNTPKFDTNGLPMHRVMETPYGRIPYGMAKGGLVKKRKSK